MATFKRIGRQEVATVVPEAIPVVHIEHGDEDYLSVDVPNGWEDVQTIKSKVLSFKGKNYAYTGWNSDKFEAYFKVDACAERIARFI